MSNREIILSAHTLVNKRPVMQIEYHPGSQKYIVWIDSDHVSIFANEVIADRVESVLSADTVRNFLAIAADNDLFVPVDEDRSYFLTGWSSR